MSRFQTTMLHAPARLWRPAKVLALPALAGLLLLANPLLPPPAAAQDPTYTLQWITFGADKGQAWAQSMLGSLYESGQGVPQNTQLAAHWYQKAVDQGETDAMYRLGALYYDGRGVTQDYEQALTLVRQAAQAGHPQAQNLLGDMHAFGRGLDQDTEQAMQWWQQAADGGIPDAMFNLANVYLHDKKKPRKAAKWLHRAGFNFVEQRRSAEAHRALAVLQDIEPDSTRSQELQAAVATLPAPPTLKNSAPQDLIPQEVATPQSPTPPEPTPVQRIAPEPQAPVVESPVVAPPPEPETEKKPKRGWFKRMFKKKPPADDQGAS